MANYTNTRAYAIGNKYIRGQISIKEVEEYLQHGEHGYMTRRELHAAIRQGVEDAERGGIAVSHRVQPKQDAIKFGPNAGKRASKTGKLATRPEHTRWKALKQAEKQDTRKPTKASRAGALNAYDVKTQRKKDLKILLDKHTRGQLGVKEVKREAKTVAAGAARKNVVYNDTKHKYIGKNRIDTTKPAREHKTAYERAVAQREKNAKRVTR